MKSVEGFFLRYAFPCAHVLLDMGAMSGERYKEIERCARDDLDISREVIEESFPAAFRRIRDLAGHMGLEDYWDQRVMEEYWYRNHNEVIDKRDGNYSKFPESFCDFCKVHEAEVLEKLSEGFLLIGYEDVRRPVCGDYVLDVKIGDRVRIHHAYAVEKIED